MMRTHVLLRLFVLMAMTLSFAETVWASTCVPMSIMATADPAAGNGAMPDMPGMPADGEQQDRDQDPSCPLGPAASAQGCLTAASLPATSVEGLGSGDESTSDIEFFAKANDFSYGSPPFHPPRA